MNYSKLLTNIGTKIPKASITYMKPRFKSFSFLVSLNYLKGNNRFKPDFWPTFPQQVTSRSIVIGSNFPDADIPDVDLFTFIKNKYMEHPETEVFVNSITKEVWKAEEVIQSAEKLASALSKRGFKQGDCLCLFATNCPEYAVVCYAVLALGGILFPANTSFLPSELMIQLNASSSKFFACTANLLTTAKDVFKDVDAIQDLILLDDEADGTTSFKLLMSDDGSAFSSPPEIDSKSDIAFLAYSSGTTGFPKGVMLTHNNIIANQVQFMNPSRQTANPGESIMGLLPFYNVGGLLAMIHFTLYRARVVTFPAFEPTHFLKSIQDYKMTVLPMVPPLVIFLTKHPMVDNFDITSVRTITSVGAPLSQETEIELSKRTGIKDIRQGYGLTETLGLTTSLCPGVRKVNYPGSTGVILSNTKMKVLNIETGAILGYGKTGEICCHGPQVMKGYLNNPEATAGCLDEDGWFHTGDIGHFTPDGNLFVTDRLKELIKYRGHQVAPAELESLLLTHESVADAAVIGIPAAEDVGELPKAFVVLKQGVTDVTENDIMDFVAQRVSPFSKLRGGVSFIDAIPKSAAGKILRRKLLES